jgi:hypothetical protein
MESIAQSAMVPASLKGKESVMDNGVSFLPAASRARWIKHAICCRSILALGSKVVAEVPYTIFRLYALRISGLSVSLKTGK